MPKKLGIAIVTVGAVLITSALLLLLYNRCQDAQAGRDAAALLAKVQALLRRTYDFGQAAPTLLSHEGLLYNPADGTVEFQGKTVPLSKNESRILGVLLRHKGETVSRETLMNALWETDCFVDENTLTVNVTRLRRRLESIGAPDMIQTRKGVGYLIS